MYIRFVLDPFVPHGIYFVIDRVINDLSRIFKKVTYSIETDDSLGYLSKRESVSVSRVLNNNLPKKFKGIIVCLLNTSLTFKKEPVYGVSFLGKCVIGIRDIKKGNLKKWAAKIWDLCLHEIGHTLGLIEKSRTRSRSDLFDTEHCLRNCSMSNLISHSVWNKKAVNRFKRRSPYCKSCLKHISEKDA